MINVALSIRQPWAKPLRPLTPFGDPRCTHIRFDGQRCVRTDAGAAGFCAAHLGATSSAEDLELLTELRKAERAGGAS